MIATGTAWRGRIAVAAGLAALAALPFFSGFATQRFLVEVYTLFAIALAWNLLAGYGGLVAIGQHAFVGTGIYALFIAAEKLSPEPWLLLPLAPLAAASLAIVSAAPLFRLRGPHFAVGTWVLAELLRIGTLNSAWLGAGGGLPLQGLADLDRAQRNAGVYWAALVVATVAFFGVRGLLRGRMGLALTSVRDAEAAAATCGVPVERTKRVLWVIAAAITGAAGAVSAMSTPHATPDSAFGLHWTAAAIFISVLGGIGTLEGPLLGTLVYFVLREAFSAYGAAYLIGLGGLAMLVIVAAPEGLWGLVNRRRSFDPFGMRRRAP